MTLSSPNFVVVSKTGDAPVAVGLGQIAVARSHGALMAQSLGSGVAVTIYDPEAQVGGLLHFMLPDASARQVKAQANPAMFADSGVPLLLERARALGCDVRRLVICAAGGADLVAGEALIRIGERNCAMLRQVFRQNQLLLRAHDTGGCRSRTLSLALADGTVTVRSRGKEAVLWKRAA